MKYAIPKDAIILSINDSYQHNRMIGLKIETDKGDILLLIEDYQSCCENYGSNFLETPDDISKFIGAKIVRVVDTNIDNDKGYTEMNETQLKIVTKKGVLQYAVYNEHNGYYSHATFLQVFDTVEKGHL